MSGIFGIFYRNSDLCPASLLDSMANALAHWGPDGRRCWQEGAVGLGHLQLYNTPESLYEQLPMSHPAYPHLTMTAAVRLDNRAELLAQLALSSAQSPPLTDSELLLHAYARWGAACPRQLLGAFAFAIWDCRQHQLFCARDHMGFYPFYYHLTAHRFIFASAIKGVLAVEGVPTTVDEAALFAARALGSRELKARTPLTAIRKLPPAMTLTVTPTGQQQHCYWRPAAAPALPKLTLDEYAAGLRTEVDRAVAATLRSAFPIGAHLSGGLDSSTVTVVAQRHLRAQGRTLAATYSWSPPPKPEEYPLRDERALVAAVCEQEGLTCEYIQVTPADVAALQQRNPVTEPVETLQYEMIVCRQAAHQGIRVLLSGWGGDEVVTFNGDGVLAAWFVQGRWTALARELRLRSRQQGGSWWSIFKAQVIFPLLPVWAVHRVRRLPALAQQGTLTAIERAQVAQNLAQMRPAVGARRTQHKRLANGHLTKRIEAWADYGAGARIEHRYPLLDRRLLDYCLGLPPALTLHQGWKRYLFRYAFQSLLPASVTWRIGKRDDAFLQTFAERRSWALAQPLSTSTPNDGGCYEVKSR